MELVEAVKYFFRKDWNSLVQIWGGSRLYVVTNEGVHEAGEDMGEISRSLV